MEKEQKLYIVVVAIFLAFLMTISAILGGLHVRNMRARNGRRRKDDLEIIIE